MSDEHEERRVSRYSSYWDCHIVPLTLSGQSETTVLLYSSYWGRIDCEVERVVKDVMVKWYVGDGGDQGLCSCTPPESTAPLITVLSLSREWRRDDATAYVLTEYWPALASSL
jgi:hypothetical protein